MGQKEMDYDNTTTLAHLVLAPAGGWGIVKTLLGLINTNNTHHFIPIHTYHNTTNNVTPQYGAIYLQFLVKNTHYGNGSSAIIF